MKNEQKKISPMFRVIKWVVRKVYPTVEIEGIQNLPDEPMVVVGNHAQLHGPIVCELFFDDSFHTWCAGEMMKLKDVPAYAFKDFWSEKPGYIRWLFRIASYAIAPLSVVVFNNARTIGVYHDNRILSTFRQSLAKLQNGESLVIFPEHNIERNNIIYDFQDKFVDIARLYYKKTGKNLPFVPMYVAPELKKLYLGTPIYFCADNPPDEERKRICTYLMDGITEIAGSLPKHTVVPYRNIPKKLYPVNITQKR